MLISNGHLIFLFILFCMACGATLDDPWKEESAHSWAWSVDGFLCLQLFLTLMAFFAHGLGDAMRNHIGISIVSVCAYLLFGAMYSYWRYTSFLDQWLEQNKETLDQLRTTALEPTVPWTSEDEALCLALHYERESLEKKVEDLEEQAFFHGFEDLEMEDLLEYVDEMPEEQNIELIKELIATKKRMEKVAQEGRERYTAKMDNLFWRKGQTSAIEQYNDMLYSVRISNLSLPVLRLTVFWFAHAVWKIGLRSILFAFLDLVFSLFESVIGKMTAWDDKFGNMVIVEPMEVDEDVDEDIDHSSSEEDSCGLEESSDEDVQEGSAESVAPEPDPVDTVEPIQDEPDPLSASEDLEPSQSLVQDAGETGTQPEQPTSSEPTYTPSPETSSYSSDSTSTRRDYSDSDSGSSYSSDSGSSSSDSSSSSDD